jgi:hypothetical protein
MRGDHGQLWHPLSEQYLNNASNFYHDATTAIDQLFLEMPALCNSIAVFTTIWNPLFVRQLSKAF